MSKTLYKRKNIDFSQPFWENRPDRYYLNNVMMNYTRLQEIHDGKINYIPSDYALLINTFEQLYKGVLRELQDLYPDKIKYSDSVYTAGHHFSQYTYQIDKFIPLSDNSEGFNKIKDFLNEIENLYNGARYNIHKSPEEFRTDFRKLERGIYRLSEGLKKEYEKNCITSEEEDDLENW